MTQAAALKAQGAGRTSLPSFFAPSPRTGTEHSSLSSHPVMTVASSDALCAIREVEGVTIAGKPDKGGATGDARKRNRQRACRTRFVALEGSRW